MEAPLFLYNNGAINKRIYYWSTILLFYFNVVKH